MKRIRNEPRLLPNVMEAIASMKGPTGSTQKQITGHISQWLVNTDDSKNMAMKVRKALKYALQSGLIKQIRGKYSLGLDKRDNVKSRRITDPYSDCNACRGRGRRGRRGKRSGGRRRSRSRRRRSKRRSRHPTRRRMSTQDDVIQDIESNMNMMDTAEPVDKSGRRKIKRRRNKRRSRRSSKTRRHSSKTRRRSSKTRRRSSKTRRRSSKTMRCSTLDGVNSDISDVDREELKDAKIFSEEEKPEYQFEEGCINSDTSHQ
ncbi:serine/arginine-rich splicing factor 7-like [Euwallacea fornicatus]|uniref:serine/arginine-rich splicing factor 7-like n=1 Tax=Euwallacea fornicatus TaxID=995702 RepID=UPI00338DFB29